MKFAAIILALLGAAIGGFSADTRAPRVDRVWLAGKEYVRLDQWARANSLQLRWLGKNDLMVSSATTRMNFTAESRRMLLNGISVLLSEPVRAQPGVPYISNVDLNAAIHPILFPPRNSPRQKVKSICIDAGHGGKDPGKMLGREQEKKYTLLLAEELGAQLRKLGYSVSFTRASDTFIELPVRADIARRRSADLFISLHFNAAPSSSVQGAQVYCMTPQRASSSNAGGEGATSQTYPGNINNSKNMLLAYELQKSIVRGAGAEDQSVRRARFQVLREVNMPAALIEAGYMSSPSESKKIFSAAWRKQLAQSIVTGIESYRKTVER